MKTGTDVHKAIDMSVVMCLSEKMHYQLSNLSPPTADGGGGRWGAQEVERWDAQATRSRDELDLIWQEGSGPGRRGAGRTEQAEAPWTAARSRWAARWPGCGRRGSGNTFFVAIGSLLDKMKAPSTCNLNICFCEYLVFRKCMGQKILSFNKYLLRASSVPSFSPGLGKS